MSLLNARWLRIELDAIDAAAEGWSEALRASYEASQRTLKQDKIRKNPKEEIAEQELAV